MFYTKEELSSLTRKDLQKLCKQFRIKANKKNCELVEELCTYFSTLQHEEKELESELKSSTAICITEDEESTEERLSTVDNENLKNELLHEVEKRAVEKITKIPRFQADKVVVIPSLLSPATENINKQHNRKFQKMDSIDVYLQKKRKRAEENFSYQKKLKLEAESSLKQMKLSHNTPATADPVSADQKRKSVSKERTLVQSKAWNTKSPMFNLKIDKEVSFNFVSKLKLPKLLMVKRTSPRLNTLKEKELNIKPAVRWSLKPASDHTRKSVQFTNLSKTRSTHASKPGVKLNQTISDLRSPGFTSSTTPTKKTPIKFDLQASLKKRPSYKPYVGKLKYVYHADRASFGATQRGDGNKSFNSKTEQKVSVKEMTRKKTVTKDKRRATTAKRRDDRRTDYLSKRRGIMC